MEGPFTLPPLPYAEDALDPHISAKTMGFHYGKHHKGYVEKLNKAVEGKKLAYCMEDTIRVLEGPNVGCEKVYDCYTQGIQPGWSDLYGNALDCQWLDITDIEPGNYQLRIHLNPGRAFQEISFDNNSAMVPVTRRSESQPARR